jgi:hypothetical protein
METFQNRNLTSTTVTFWIMNIAARPIRTRTNINLRFIFFTFAEVTGNYLGSTFRARLPSFLSLSDCHPKWFSEKFSFFEFINTHYLIAFCEAFYVFPAEEMDDKATDFIHILAPVNPFP